MKTITFVLSFAFVVISAVMISLVRSGGALKPAGVIKAAEVGDDPSLIGKQIAVRLYPDFHAAQSVIWRIENGSELFAQIARTAFDNYRGPRKPQLIDSRHQTEASCSDTCWYIINLGTDLPESVQQRVNESPTAEIFIQTFHRDEAVPEVCESEKILTVGCMRPISVREVRRKIKTPAPHYFMQRYQQSQFYLFVEVQ